MTKKKKVNLKQLSKILQVTQTTIRDWITTKGMPAQRTNKGFLCDVDEVFKWRERYLLEKKQNSEGYEQAKTERMLWLSKSARLNYEREAGLLVCTKEVSERWFQIARTVRDSILNIPDRLSAILAAESNREKCHALLTSELRLALENLVDEIRTQNEASTNESEVKNEVSTN